MPVDHANFTNIASIGSDLYYSLLFTEKEKRNQIVILHEFYHAISEIPLRCKEKSVAEKKLAWWEQEIELIYNNDLPAHPIAQALIEPIYQYKLSKQLFTGIIAGIKNNLDYPVFTTYSELILYCHHTLSLREILISYCLESANKETLSFARDIGAVFRLIEIMRNLRSDLKRGFLYLPLEELERFSIKKSDLIQLKNPPELGNLLRDWQQKIHEIYHNTLNNLTANDKLKLNLQIIASNISLKLLQKMAKDDFQVLQKYYTLTPITKFFIAWKTHYRKF